MTVRELVDELLGAEDVTREVMVNGKPLSVDDISRVTADVYGERKTCLDIREFPGDREPDPTTVRDLVREVLDYGDLSMEVLLNGSPLCGEGVFPVVENGYPYCRKYIDIRERFF